MPRLIWTQPALAGLVKNFQFLDAQDADAAQKALEAIVQGVKILEKYPNAGRPAWDLEPEHRELLIAFGATGYLVLYQVQGEDVLLLAVKHQRQAGY